MAATNSDIAAIFYELADLLELQDANPFRVRAYRRAAQNIEALDKSVATLVRQDTDLTTLEGIGADLAMKVEQIVQSGTLSALQDERKKVPAGLAQVMQVEGVGPKRARLLHKRLGVSSIEDLQKAAHGQRIRDVQGFGPKTEQKIAKGISRLAERQKRFLRHQVVPVAEGLVQMLKEVKGTQEVVVAGSYRRRKETVGDLDLLATAKDSRPLMEVFTGSEDVAEVVSQGETRSTVILHNGLQVDLRVVPEESYGAALYYFTGSKAHNIAVRKRAIERGYKLNEYGLFRDDKQIAGRSEKEVTDAIEMDEVPPELREDRGEVEAAAGGSLPDLVTLDDIRGDLHCHTTATDGKDTIRAMAQAAMRLGHEYLAITDHTARTQVANGLDADAYRKHIQNIEQVDAELEGITLLRGAEVDILKDGTLDLPQDVLEDLDVVVCSMHFPADLNKRQQTQRIIDAMHVPHAQILGHPTGRKINKRGPYDLDLERLMEAAADEGWCMEIDAQPNRLDLNDVHARMAKEHGVPVVISSDAHRATHLQHQRYGVDQARRAWLEKDDVLNTRPLKTLKASLKRD